MFLNGRYSLEQVLTGKFKASSYLQNVAHKRIRLAAESTTRTYIPVEVYRDDIHNDSGFIRMIAVTSDGKLGLDKFCLAAEPGYTNTEHSHIYVDEACTAIQDSELLLPEVKALAYEFVLSRALHPSRLQQPDAASLLADLRRAAQDMANGMSERIANRRKALDKGNQARFERCGEGIDKFRKESADRIREMETRIQALFSN